jgi:6-methylsalicylate decarboxylase
LPSRVAPRDTLQEARPLARRQGRIIRAMAAGPNRIDVHHHISPPGYIAELDPKGILTRETLQWTPQQSLDLMDKGGVQVALTSITTPGLWFGDAAASRKLARLCNDYAAKLASDHPKRFGTFVNLPMPDIDASLKEIEYGLDALKAEGVVFFTSYGDKWLGDPAFDPVFDELNRRKAVIYVHPTTATCCTNVLKGINDSMIEYGTDTTRCIAQMVLSGRSQRWADLRIIWSHGGGTMPFLLVRFTRAAKGQFRKNLPNGFIPEARRYYYDTAAVYAKAPLLALREVVGIDQIVFGTDVPWGDPAEIARDVAETGVFDAAELRKIDRDNALRILPQYR